MGQGSIVAVNCGVGGRRSLGLAWLWLWRRPAALAPVQPLAWELPYAAGAARNKQTVKNFGVPVQKIKIWFSPVNLSYVNLII